ncbi:MAG TPA: M28 family peptidase [bacterium]|nr:M28 family peptidase [bacterium]HPN35790.1 M28 family peptidase [bacterium]
MKKSVIFVLLLFSFTAAQDAFDGSAAFSYVEELCLPKYKGRKTGTTEARNAALWISNQLKSWGLTPMGDENGYLQIFPMLVTEQKKKAKLKLLNSSYGAIEYRENVDFIPYQNSGSAELSAEVVFIGYGISEPSMGWDDYAGMDVKGKIVLIQRGVPQNGQDWAFANERFYKVRTAEQKGASGLLMLDRGDWPLRGVTITAEGYRPHMPIFNISKKVARDLFTGCHKNIDHLLRDLADKPHSFSFHRRMAMSSRFDLAAVQEGENVLVVVRGTDPVLADEYLVVGAHMDHNGLSLDGHLYAGADDNASGTAVVMEMARVIRQKKLKRSIIFACFGGEEQGLLGSRYFTLHPSVPAEKIVANVNLDMVGAGDGGVSISGRNYFFDLLDPWVRSHNDSVSKKLKLYRGSGVFGSDHAYFVEQGIPAFYVSSTGDHPFYHQFEDDPSTLNVQALQVVGERCVELLTVLADAPGTLLFGGNRSGYFFHLFGDQIDFSFQPATTLAKADSLRDRAIPAAVRCVVYPLPATAEEKDLFAAYDDLERRIREGSKLLRFKNSVSFDEAASGARLCAAIALNGTESLHQNAAHARLLYRAGVNWLCLRSPQDPVFDGKGLSSWGHTLVQTWAEENGVVETTLADSAQISALLAAGRVKLLLRLTPTQALNLQGFLAQRLDKKQSLVILETTPDQPVDSVWQLYDRLPAGLLHVAFAKTLSLAPEGKYQWVQKLYEARRNQHGVAKAYAAMTQVMTDNIKKFIGR